MLSIGTALKEALRWQEARSKHEANPYLQQLNLLQYQLKVAQHTYFGRTHGFTSLLRHISELNAAHNLEDSAMNLIQAQRALAAQIPCFSYEDMYRQWWYHLRNMPSDLCWPGRITHFALSSGTTTSDTKYIPTTPQMLTKMRAVGIRQLCVLAKCNFSAEFYKQPLLILSSSTALRKVGARIEGDISGMLAQRPPIWFRYHYRPSARVARIQDWEEKLEAIVADASKWNIGGVSGSPTWMQLLFERIIARYGLENIHELWPGLQLFVHGGVSFDPYRESFRQLLGKDITYLETYLASEGFIAYQADPQHNSMRLALAAGLFYEFIPFEATKMDSISTDMNPQALSLAEVEINKPYSLIISNLSGLWRYVIGDVVTFHSVHPFEISIQGRTTHYLNLCGEHLCLGNLQQAVGKVSSIFQIPIKEFTVFGARKDSGFVHIWHIGIEGNVPVSAERMAEQLDATLQEFNADYRLHRHDMLAPPQVELLPSACFYDWLATQGKLGGQHKFPRVLRGEQLKSWQTQLAHTLSSTSY